MLLLAIGTCAVTALAQPTFLGTELPDGTYATHNLNDLGAFRQVRLQAASSAASGVRKWEFATGNYFENWRPYTGGQTLTITNGVINPATNAASARYNNNFGGQGGFLPAITANSYYTFNVTEYAAPTNQFMAMLETSYSPVALNSVVVSGTPADGIPVNINITTSADLSTGEYVYVRYSTDAFASSSTVLASFTGTSGTAQIPAQAEGTNVVLYAFSSPLNAAQLGVEVIAEGDITYDMVALELNTNGGTNYSYTVAEAIGTTQLSAVSCGSTLISLSSYVYCNAVANAERYQYEITNGVSFSEEVLSPGGYPGATFFNLGLVNGVMINTTYNVRVRARVGGTWGDYGATCAVSTPAAVPTTSLSAAWCGATLTSINQYFYIGGVSGAGQYEYEITDGGSFSETVPSLPGYGSATWFSLAYVDGIDYNTTYNIRIRANVGGVWGAFGPTCQLTTPALTLPTIQASYCGNTLGSIGQFFHTSAVGGAQRYQYEITDGGSFTAYGFSYFGSPSATWFSFNLVSGIQPSTTYSVRVRAKIAGTWGVYGGACNITTPASKRGGQDWTTITSEEVHLLPNPTSGSLTIALPEQLLSGELSIVGLTGQVIAQQRIVSTREHVSLDGVAPGVYIITAISAQHRFTGRVVVQ